MATSSSKRPWAVIPGAELGTLEQWRPPSLFGEPAGRADSDAAAEELEQAVATLPTAEQIEEIQRQAWDEGYAEGKKDGFEYGHREALEQGRKEIAAKLAQLDRLMGALDRPFMDLDDRVEQELLTLTVSMVRQLVRREIRTDPNQIIGVLREALSIMPVASRNVRVLLHPEDADIVREIYSLGDAEPGWTIVEDPVVQRGGCRVHSDTSQVDATLESRLNNLIAPLMGAARSEDADDEE